MHHPSHLSSGCLGFRGGMEYGGLSKGYCELIKELKKKHDPSFKPNVLDSYNPRECIVPNVK